MPPEISFHCDVIESDKSALLEMVAKRFGELPFLFK